MKNFLKIIPLFLFALLIMISFNDNKRIIVIDVGHGGQDNGAKYNEHVEKDIVFAIASKIKQQNKNSNIEIVLTRENDIYSTLSERSDFVNKINPEMVISLHLNRTADKNTDRKGSEIYYYDSNANAEQSKLLADKLSEKLGNAVVKPQNLHILRTTNVPAMLVELGFINNHDDRELLTTPHGQNQYAKQILDFLNEN